MSSQRTIHWFRQDLRLSDNPALSYAVQSGQVLPVFIDDNTVPEQARLGGASKWWLHHSLHSLNKELQGKLLIKQGEPLAVLQALIEEYEIDEVCWNRQYEPWQIARDTHIKAALKEQNIAVKSTNGLLLWEPMQVLKKDGTPYKVFTPYYRKGCLSKAQPRMPLPRVTDIQFIQHSHDTSADLATLVLLPTIKWDSEIAEQWQPGEEGAKQRLATFISGNAVHYQDARNIPSVTGTSLLSPHLHFGEVSSNQIWYALIEAFDGGFGHKDIDVYLSELGWREFSYYLLYHWPEIPHKNFNPKFDRLAWRQDDKALAAWQRGNTGIPIVDAGMRQLYRTGYMHNRVRMIVGSFLVKNLLIDWRQGERWFWDCLLDADMAANSASWQWVAGTGADAAPYFRVFNPILQGEKFDKEGRYVKRYCPELKDLPNKYIHHPWDASANILQAANITLGGNYPAPIVDLKVSRQRALDAFSALKQE